MLVVKNIRVWTLERDSLTVTWEIANTVEDVAEYTATILRSESQTGDYEEVSPAFAADLAETFEDNQVNLYSATRRYYYRIRITAGDGDYVDYGSTAPDEVAEGTDPGGVTFEAFPDLAALEAIRRFDLVAREYGGRRVLVLVERTSGQRCPECWDAVKRRRSKSGCTTCYDTGVSGGFYRPRETWAMKVPDAIRTFIGGLFEVKPADIVVWLSRNPRVKERDLVIGIDGARWRVLKVPMVSEKAWARTRQTVVLREITRDQVEYDVPIDPADWGVDSFTASPHREHVNAMDIDSYRRAARDLGVTDR